MTSMANTKGIGPRNEITRRVNPDAMKNHVIATRFDAMNFPPSLDGIENALAEQTQVTREIVPVPRLGARAWLLGAGPFRGVFGAGLRWLRGGTP